MNAVHRWKQAALAALLVIIAALAWAIFAPLQVGGSSAYIIVIGNSMEPAFRRGDLVIVRPARFYQVGEVVAYRDPRLQHYVFHRVIDRQGETYTLKGDNNDWVDSYRPHNAEIIGKLWFHLPGVGRAVQWLRRPIPFGLTVGIVSGLLLASFWLSHPGERQRKGSSRICWSWLNMDTWRNFFRQRLPCWKKKRKALSLSTDTSRPPSRSDARRWGTTLEIAFFALGLLTFISLTVGIFAFSRPLVRTVPDDIAYQHRAVFSYTASAPPGVYDAPAVTSGQPVFPSLTCLLNLHFDYALLGAEVQEVSGTYQMTARVIEPRSGWERLIPIQDKIAFQGRTHQADQIVNLCSVLNLVQSLQEKTEYRSTIYQLVIAPSLQISGHIAGRPIQDTFGPSLTFYFDSLLFYLARPDAETNPLVVSEERLSQGWKSEPNTLSILGKAFPVRTLRILSVAGMGIALANILLLLFFVGNLARRNQAQLAQVKYGAIMVEVESQPPEITNTNAMVEVASIDDLARLAERHNTTILHQAKQPLHYYLVHGSGITYRYALSESTSGLITASLVQLGSDLRRGLEQGEFQVYYQPILSLEDRRVVGVEALLRWQHPRHGLVTPEEFLAAAEATSLIEPIGQWILQTACAQLKEWRQAGLSLTLSVNFSVAQLKRFQTTRTIARLFRVSGLQPEDLWVEISETKVLEAREEVLPGLQALQENGVRIAMDNFSGQAPFSLFQQIFFNVIKLDRSLIAPIEKPQQVDFVKRSVLSARIWGSEVVAEGVENKTQLEIIQAVGNLLAQGYLLGHPMPAAQLTPLLVGSEQTAEKRKEDA